MRLYFTALYYFQDQKWPFEVQQRDKILWMDTNYLVLNKTKRNLDLEVLDNYS